MKWLGKIIGGLIGLALGGPLGFLVGVFLGHLFDNGQIGQLFHGSGPPKPNIQQEFFNATFQVMGHIAKSDGRISEQEIGMARQIMRQMGLNAIMQQEAIRLFNQGKQPYFDINETLAKLRRACAPQPALMRVFLEIQLQIAFAENLQIPAKTAAIENIYNQLGIPFNIHDFQRQTRAEQNYQRYQHYSATMDPRQHIQDAYAILGIDPSANDADVTKAYRKLMSQHHPDRLIAKGVPQEMIQIATQKTQKIKKAYEDIKKVRGI